MRTLALLLLVAGCGTSPDGGTFHVRLDPRDCVSPVCGGAWVKADDGHTIDCSSGVTNGTECYVGTLSAEPNDLLSKIANHAVEGRFEAGIVAQGKDWGAFVVTSIR